MIYYYLLLLLFDEWFHYSYENYYEDLRFYLYGNMSTEDIEKKVLVRTVIKGCGYKVSRRNIIVNEIRSCKNSRIKKL